MDLVALQENTGRIRNPFKFDFVTTWNKKPIVLKGDGEWKTVIGPLRLHIAQGLYQKIRYQYHDEQVRKLKDQGLERDARKYTVPATVENKIWMMITGEPLPAKKGKTAQIEEEEQADLSELNTQLSQLDKQALGSNEPVDVIGLIERANDEGLKAHGTKQIGESGHTGGVVNADGTDIEQKPIDTTPVNAEDLAQTTQGTNTDGPTPPTDEFSGLNELDNNTNGQR